MTISKTPKCIEDQLFVTCDEPVKSQRRTIYGVLYISPTHSLRNVFPQINFLVKRILEIHAVLCIVVSNISVELSVILSTRLSLRQI